MRAVFRTFHRQGAKVARVLEPQRRKGVKGSERMLGRRDAETQRAQRVRVNPSETEHTRLRFAERAALANSVVLTGPQVQTHRLLVAIPSRKAR